MINNASGGVGTFAVQIAKTLGAEVTGVCSTRNVEMVRSIGADHVFDHTKEDFTRSGQRYDLILDNLGTHSFSAYRRVLAPQGMVIPNTGHAGMGYLLRASLLSARGRQVGKMFSGAPTTEDLVFLKELLESGKITPIIDRTYPLSQTPAAMGYAAQGHGRGKVVITVDQHDASDGGTMTSAAASEPRRSKAEKFWDRLARTWDKPTEESEQTDTKVLAKTRPYLKATDTVLDYGCAKGSVDLKLAAAVKAIHGIDISSTMIAAAREAAEARGVANVSFAKATIFDEGLERESFEVVLAFSIFHLLEDAPKALRRIDELLKPGGLLISVTPCLGERGTLRSGA